MVIYLGSASRQTSCPLPARFFSERLEVAPGGVCPERALPHIRVVSYTAISPLPFNKAQGGLFLLHFSAY